MKEYIGFSLKEMSPSGRTKIITVTNAYSGIPIGEIKWYAPWRRYVFAPLADVVFDPSCLHQIATILDTQTLEHSQKERVN